MAHEKMMSFHEIEQNLPSEIERKYIPLFPEDLNRYREQSIPIEQVYLSHPDEPFSLRMRETFDASGTLTYSATLKDRGTITAAGLERLEIEVPISADIYYMYRKADAPMLRKLRAEPEPGVCVDFYEDATVRIEAEDAMSWQRFLNIHGDTFMEATGDAQISNEWLAHATYRKLHRGEEVLEPTMDLNVKMIARAIQSRLSQASRVVVHIGGRSGSGKSTVVRDLQDSLCEQGVNSVVLSTDDYHRGTEWLTSYNNGAPWINWDAPVVYDIAAAANDIGRLAEGAIIQRRTIDWSIAEPLIEGYKEPASVIIVEGIYALHAEVLTHADLAYEMPTPLATCIGRRLLRDLKERPEFADPLTSLRYMLEYAEPAYQAQMRART